MPRAPDPSRDMYGRSYDACVKDNILLFARTIVKDVTIVVWTAIISVDMSLRLYGWLLDCFVNADIHTAMTCEA